MDARAFGRLLVLIQTEYLDRPDLRMTWADVQARWDADQVTCQAALTLLADASVLRPTADGAYVRFDCWRRGAAGASQPTPALACGLEFRSLAVLVRATRPRARKPEGTLHAAFEPRLMA
jgi:hypothetical protein